VSESLKSPLSPVVDELWEQRACLSPEDSAARSEVVAAVDEIDAGNARVAFVDPDGTMVDTWATVGSCAQIGKNVHLSGGAGIGGVLEGARVRTGAVLGSGTNLGRNTHVIDAATGEELPRGEAPAWSV
jgi:NDP-sugar pyrophosphorylase family protein